MKKMNKNVDAGDLIALIEVNEEEIKDEIKERAKKYKLENEDIYSVSVPITLEMEYDDIELRYHEFEIGQLAAYSKIKDAILNNKL